MTIIKTIDGKNLELSELAQRELDLLHYEQECKYASLILENSPFSDARRHNLHEGYKLIHQIMKEKASRANPNLTDFSFGAKDAYVKLCVDIIKKQKNKYVHNQPLLFFEAGIGSGKILRGISEISNVNVTGCDVFVDSQFISEKWLNAKSNIKVLEGSLFDVLENLEDNCIDVFYWNDVLEHIPVDEIDEHIKRIASKLRNGGGDSHDYSKCACGAL